MDEERFERWWDIVETLIAEKFGCTKDDAGALLGNANRFKQWTPRGELNPHYVADVAAEVYGHLLHPELSIDQMREQVHGSPVLGIVRHILVTAEIAVEPLAHEAGRPDPNVVEAVTHAHAGRLLGIPTAEVRALVASGALRMAWPCGKRSGVSTDSILAYRRARTTEAF